MCSGSKTVTVSRQDQNFLRYQAPPTCSGVFGPIPPMHLYIHTPRIAPTHSCIQPHGGTSSCIQAPLPSWCLSLLHRIPSSWSTMACPNLPAQTGGEERTIWPNLSLALQSRTLTTAP